MWLHGPLGAAGLEPGAKSIAGARSIAGSVFPSKNLILKLLKAISYFSHTVERISSVNQQKKFVSKYVHRYPCIFPIFKNRKFKNMVFLKPFFFIRQNVPIFLMQTLKEDYGLNNPPFFIQGYGEEILSYFMAFPPLNQRLCCSGAISIASAISIAGFT
jgi:hypothetical protein